MVRNNNSLTSTSVFKALEKALDPLGPDMKEALYLHLAKKYGISFIGDYASVKEIEDALVIIFERGATPLIRRFKENLKN
jgi:hypothetical protein